MMLYYCYVNMRANVLRMHTWPLYDDTYLFAENVGNFMAGKLLETIPSRISVYRSKRTLTTALHFVPETDVHADIAAVKATKFAKQDLLKAT